MTLSVDRNVDVSYCFAFSIMFLQKSFCALQSVKPTAKVKRVFLKQQQKQPQQIQPRLRPQKQLLFLLRHLCLLRTLYVQQQLLLQSICLIHGQPELGSKYQLG